MFTLIAFLNSLQLNFVNDHLMDLGLPPIELGSAYNRHYRTRNKPRIIYKFPATIKVSEIYINFMVNPIENVDLFNHVISVIPDGYNSEYVTYTSNGFYQIDWPLTIKLP